MISWFILLPNQSVSRAKEILHEQKLNKYNHKLSRIEFFLLSIINKYWSRFLYLSNHRLVHWDPPLDFGHKYWSEIAYALFTIHTSCQLSQWYPTGMRAMYVCRRWLRLITTLAVCLYVNFALNACNLTIPRGRSGFCESARNRFFALSCLGTLSHCWHFTWSHCFELQFIFVYRLVLLRFFYVFSLENIFSLKILSDIVLNWINKSIQSS